MAVLDTAWHQTMHPEVFMYALQKLVYQTQHQKIWFPWDFAALLRKRAAVLLGKDPFQTNVVILHIGNGVSANAVKRFVLLTPYGADPT